MFGERAARQRAPRIKNKPQTQSTTMNTTQNATTVRSDRSAFAVTRGSSLRRFLACVAILPFVGATLAFAGSGTLIEKSKQLTNEFISCRVQYFGPTTTILGRATVDGRGVGEAVTHRVSNGEIVRFRFYGNLRNPSGGIINLRSDQTGTVRVKVDAN